MWEWKLRCSVGESVHVECVPYVENTDCASNVEVWVLETDVRYKTEA